MLGIGGVIGSIASAFLSQYLHPKYTFLLCSFISLSLVFISTRLKKSVEVEGDECRGPAERKDFLKELNLNYQIIKHSIKLPQIYKTIIYVLLIGFLIPTFVNFMYYYNINVVGLSKFTISIMSAISYVVLFLAAIMFEKFLLKYEYRSLLTAAQYFGFFGAILGLVYTLRLNEQIFRISDPVFLIFYNSLNDICLTGFRQIPTMALFAKLTPFHVEASIFAFLTGIFNF